MNLKRLECQKIIVNRSFMGTFLLLFVLNLITSYYVYQDQGVGRVTYTNVAYKAVYSDLDGMDAEKAYDYLVTYWDKITEQYQEGKTYQLLYTDNYESESLLITEIMENIDQCIHYQSYLDHLSKDADQLMEVGLVKIASKFEKRNIAKLERDKEKMRDKFVAYGPAKGIELFGDTMTTDFFVLLLLLMLVVQLMTKEKESSQLKLYRSAYHGQRRLALAKLNVILRFAVVTGVLFQGTNLLLIISLYGIGNVHRLIQSVNCYQNCFMPISVAQYLLIFFISKIWIYICLTVFAFWIAVIAKRSQILYFIISILYMLGGVLYFSIHEYSRYVLWKYINPFAMLKVGNIIGNYRNLNIGNIPCPYLYVFWVVTMILVIILWGLSVRCFAQQTEVSERGQNKWYRQIAFVNWSERSVSIFHQEAYKLLFNGRLLYLLLGYSLFIIATYKPATENFYINRDVYYDAYIDHVKGPVTEETEQFIASEDQKFEQLEKRYTAGEIQADYMDYMMRSYQSFEKLRDNTTVHLKKSGGEYIHETGYQLLTGDIISNSIDIKLGLLVVVVLLYPLAFLFGIDHQLHTISFIHATQHGKKKRIIIKVVLGIITVTSVYLLTYAPFYYSVLSKFGVESIHAPACSLVHLAHIPRNISLFMYLLFVAVMRYIGYLIMMCGIFWISRKSKSVIGACMWGILLLVLPMVFAYLQIPGMSYILLNPLIIGNVF